MRANETGFATPHADAGICYIYSHRMLAQTHPAVHLTTHDKTRKTQRRSQHASKAKVQSRSAECPVPMSLRTSHQHTRHSTHLRILITAHTTTNDQDLLLLSIREGTRLLILLNTCGGRSPHTVHNPKPVRCVRLAERTRVAGGERLCSCALSAMP